jgi:hypothetical protein
MYPMYTATVPRHMSYPRSMSLLYTPTEQLAVSQERSRHERAASLARMQAQQELEESDTDESVFEFDQPDENPAIMNTAVMY